MTGWTWHFATSILERELSVGSVHNGDGDQRALCRKFAVCREALRDLLRDESSELEIHLLFVAP